MPDNIEKVKDRLDIVDVVSGYIKLQKVGANFKARCPFHNEKTPSFYVSPERQIWHCFGCAKGGDMFGFVKEIEGVEFPEALRILAHRAGVELEEFNMRERNTKSRLYAVAELASKFFEKQLWQSPQGKRALEYLRGRGLTDETIKEFRIGFAPESWDALNAYLLSSGYSDKEIVDAGMAIRRQSGDESEMMSQESRGIYDRFRSRITFPVFDLQDQVVGFSGRVFAARGTNPPELKAQSSKLKAEDESSEPAKYINTPQTLIYDKSKVLYGLNKARTAVRTEDRCVFVEGNMDVILSYQAGVTNTVATSGTALTQQHLRLIGRYTTNLDFCFDTDAAGDHATKRAIGLALAQGFSVRAIELDDKECKDPADYVKKHGGKWKSAVGAAKPIIEYYFEKARSRYDGSPEAKKSVVAALAPFVKRLASQVEKAHWVSQISLLLRVKEVAIEADFATAKDDLSVYEHDAADAVLASVPAPQAPAVQMETDILHETLLSLLLKHPALFQPDFQHIDYHLLEPWVADVVAKLANFDLAQFQWGGFMKQFDDDLRMRLEVAYLRSQEFWADFADDELRSEFYNILQKIKKKSIMAQLVNLELDIREAETLKDSGKISTLIARFTHLTQELSSIQKV